MQKANVKPKVEKIEQQLKERKFHKYLWYLIIFSILGLILECVINFIKAKTTDTPFLVTTGPFCIFYGIGAILTILCLQKNKIIYNWMHFNECYTICFKFYIRDYCWS